MCAILCVPLVMTACTPAPDSPSDDAAPSASVSAPASPSLSPEIPRHLLAADRANTKVANTVVAISARPTATIQDSRLMAMVIRDEGRDEWEAGNYRLVVYCVGEGTVFAHFRIGGESGITELPPCSPTVTTGTVDLHLAADAKNSSVLIIPAGNAQAAVAYQIQKM
ncbi:hypothetical protein [Micromonospora globbae]|uniref:Uncharacterized protein n=1 Tax=Micromonospora globbae TaxID=1894969 RepID=A0A420EVP0_9ACTN|nr:hypothetical protein [Micromonospora globbae]RKF24798.1 hypothetical protein D7I43_24695 [Micromonospora globbae]